MRKFPEDFNFVPNTYLMLYDFEKIKNIIKDAKKNDIFIMKPVASGFIFILACGRGIKLINNKKKLKKNPNYLISEYI
jgi:tubulin polyglutamylase TTLL4